MAWLDTLNRVANDEGVDGMARFYDPAVIVDDRSLGQPAATWSGFDAARGLLGAVFPGGQRLHVLDEPALLTPEGAVMLASLRLDVLRREGSTHVAHIFESIGPLGIESEIDIPNTSWWADERRDSSVGRVADAIADRWVAAWSSGDPAIVGPMYTLAARLVDAVAGVDVTSGDLRSLVAPGVGWSVGTVGENGERAVYPYMSVPGRLAGVLVVVEGDDGSACPGRQAVWMVLGQDGRIATETRYRSPADARRCLPAAELPIGWWDDRPIPQPTTTVPVREDLDIVTATVVVGGRSVEVRNGTPALERLTRWAFERFELAGLDPPSIGSITFTRASGFCGAAKGHAQRIDSVWQVALCFDDARACSDDGCTRFDLAAREAMLHELAHVWMDEHLDAPRRTAFMRHVGLSVWQDPGVAWDGQAGEHAAETLAWGLLDEPMALITLGIPASEQLAEGYRILTDGSPLQPAAP